MIDLKRFKGSPSLRRLRDENGKVFKSSISRSGIMNSGRLGAGVGKCVRVCGNSDMTQLTTPAPGSRPPLQTPAAPPAGGTAETLVEF